MKNFIISCALTMSPAIGSAHDPCPSHAHLELNFVHTEQLFSWYRQGVVMTILDARGRSYLDGLRLPDALWSSQRSTDEDLRKLVPDLNALVVVYCSNIGCPASEWMATRLIKLGYTNIYEYPEGIDGWMDAGYEVETMELR